MKLSYTHTTISHTMTVAVRITVLLALAMPFFALAQDTYVDDPAHTSVTFKVLHKDTGYTFGRFNEYDGTMVYDRDNLDASSFEFYINAASVDTNNTRRDDHLRSPDFFNTAQFPTIEFVSKSIRQAPDDAQQNVQVDGEAVFEIVGDLTLHGTTKEITVYAVKVGEGTTQNGKPIIGMLSEFTIDRTEYGVDGWLEAAGPLVDITLSFEGMVE